MIGGLERLDRIGDIVRPTGKALHGDKVLTPNHTQGTAEKGHRDRARQGRRALPELRMHPRQGGPALSRSALRDPRGRRVRPESERGRGRLCGDPGSPREGRLHAHLRRLWPVQEKRHRLHRGRRRAHGRRRRARGHPHCRRFPLRPARHAAGSRSAAAAISRPKSIRTHR